MISIKNPFNPSYDAIKITSVLTADVQPSIIKDKLLITGSFESISLKVNTVKTFYKQPEKTTDDVEKKINVFLETIKDKLSQHFLS